MAESPLSADKAAEALQGISAALADFVVLAEGAHRESLQTIATALTDVVQMMEAHASGNQDRAASAQRQVETQLAAIAKSIAGLKFEPKIMFEPKFEPKFEPTINVPTQQLSMTVDAPDVHNHITVDAQPQFSRMKVDFVFQGERIVGGVITRES